MRSLQEDGFSLATGQRVILLKQVHDGRCEVGHILANHEGQVTSMHLLVIDNVITNLITSPFGVSDVGRARSAAERGPCTRAI